MRLVTIFLSTLIVFGCTSISKDNRDPLLIDASPLVFKSYEESNRVGLVYTPEGSGLIVGDNETGFVIHRVSPELHLGDGPNEMGVDNRKFLETLADPSRSSDSILKFRNALELSDLSKIEVVEKGEWFFITISNEIGATAYGADRTDGWVYMLVYPDDLSELVQFIENSSVKEK